MLTRGPQPGDNITPEDLKPESVSEPKLNRFQRLLQRLPKSEVQPGMITGKSGKSSPGIKWGRKF